jgi:magnesium-transporting ATPase (P-type)
MEYAPAIRAAEIGISVEGATDVARSAADIILLAQGLEVLADGVEEGRRTFINILKCVRMGTSKKAAAPSSTSSNTSAWGRAPTSATCCQWRLLR